MNLSDDMKRVVREQRLGFVATVTPDGHPNLSPKGTLIVVDDGHLAFADIASPGTIANLEANEHVEVNVVDPIVRTGYRFKGVATIYDAGPTFERCLGVLRALGSTMTADRIRNWVVIDVTAAAKVSSPAYDSGATEAEISARWLAHHNDLHRELRPRSFRQ